MSAREEFINLLQVGLPENVLSLEDIVDEILNQHAKELAEKIRLYRDSYYGPGEFKAEKKALNGAINLIDPYVKGD